MAKTLSYRLFGAGKIPRDAVSQIQIEGLVFSEEGVAGTLTLRNFRAPGRYHGWRRNWFSGSIVLTRKHLLAFARTKPVIGLAWDDEKFKALIISLEKKDILLIQYDSSVFESESSGQVELRFKTSNARTLFEHIEQRARK